MSNSNNKGKRKRNDNNIIESNNDLIDNSKNSCNNNNDNNKISFKKFKEMGVDNFKLKELQSYAVTFELTKSGTKQQLYDKIENHLKKIDHYLQTINSIEEEGQVKQNLNQFNKYQPKLVINDQVLPLELLFWKIFRNKAIYTNIFSNFQYNQIYSYHDIIGVGKTLNKYSNGQEIIKDKIKSNNYIIRDYQNDIASIFKTFIKDNQDINQFYNNFFNLYKPANLEMQFISNPQHWISIIINESNVTALKIYINKFKITQQQIKSIISKCNLYLNSTYQQFKMYHYLAINNYLPLDYQFNIDLINIFTPNFKFRHLIKYFSAIINNIKYYNNNHSISNNKKKRDNNKNNNKDNSTKYNQIVTELKQIKLDQFTNQQLNTTLKELAINEFLNDIGDSDSDSGCNTSNNRKSSNKSSNGGEINEIIYKYCKIIYSKSRNKPNEYYTLYKDYNNKRFQKILEIKFFVKSPNLEPKVYASTVLDIVQVTLRNNIQSQESVLRRICGCLANYFFQIELFITFISINNIKLIEIFLRIGHISITNIPIVLLFKTINSTLVLDYLYENYQDIYFSDGNLYWKSIKSSLVLNHYKMLMNKCGRNFGNDHKYSVEDLISTSNRPKSPIEFWNLISQITSKQKLSQIIKNTTLDFSSIEIPFEIENSNISNVNINQKIVLNFNELFDYLFYSNWFSISELYEEFPHFMYIFQKNLDVCRYKKYPVYSLKFLVVHPLEKNLNLEFLSNLFKLLCSFGSLSIIKQILSQHPNFLKNTSTSTSIFNDTQIIGFIKISAKFGNEDLARFLISYINPSKNQLKALKILVSKEINR